MDMNSEILYSEVRAANMAVKEIEAADSARAKAGTKMLFDAVKMMEELSCAARKEGLLYLEEATCDMDKSGANGYLSQMILLIVDGTEPEIVEEIGTAKYFASCVSGYEALLLIAYVWGALSIQAGANPRVLEQQLLSIMPESVCAAYEKKREEEEKAEEEAGKAAGEHKNVVDMSLVEKYSTGESPIKFGEDAYFITRIMDYLFREGMEDRVVQRVLRDIDNSDLTLIMKALSGEARGHIFNNLSQRLAVMIAQDIEYMGRVPLNEITEAEYKVLRVIVKLYARGEIVVRDGAMIENFAKVIGISFESRKQNEKLNTAENELEKLVNEYMTRDRRLI
jgi:hypothetical protein